ncbi:MAG: AI-2E family transporter [bacterium]|nr:AI-2E family transporter [bacterium]
MNQQDREAPRRFEWLRGMGIASWSIVGACAVLALLVWILLQLRIIWPPLIFAVIIVYLFKPLVDRLERYRVPRVAGGCLAYLLFGGLLVLIGVLIVPVINEQTVELVHQFPAVIDNTSSTVTDLAARLPLPETFQGLDPLGELSSWFADPSNREVILGWVSQAGEIARGVLEVAVVVFLAPVLAFYILVDAHNLRQAGERLIPSADRAEAIHLMRQIGKAVGGFIRGQLMVALVVGLLSSLTLLILDLPFWMLVGLLAGLLNIVPFIGPWVGGALGVSTALIVGDPIRAIWVAVAFLAIQQIDNHVVSPLILRVAVHLSPVTIILALLAGGSIGGLLGVLIAVPATAVLKIVAGHLWRTRVLGESWDQAMQAVLVEYQPEPLKDRIRLGRLEDRQTGSGAEPGEEHTITTDAEKPEDPEEDPPGPGATNQP